jgi:hypothetical protein
MRNFWNNLREVEWYAVMAIAFLAAAVVLATLIAVSAVSGTLWVLTVTFGFAAVVCAIFSHRT